MSANVMKPRDFYQFIGEVISSCKVTVKGSFNRGVDIFGTVKSDESDLDFSFHIKVYNDYTWEFMPKGTSFGLYNDSNICVNDLPYSLSDIMDKYGFFYLPLDSRKNKELLIKKDVRKLIRDIKKSD